MNLTSGKFTVPAKGTYFFSFSGIAKFASTSLLPLSVFLYQNENLVGNAYVNGAVINQYIPLTLQSTLHLQKGDEICLKIHAVGSGVVLWDSEWHHSHFTGFILNEDLN